MKNEKQAKTNKEQTPTCDFCQEEIVRKEGRPRKFHCVEEVETKIEDYFKECEEKEKPLTVSGLAIALDTDRSTLLEYQKNEDYKEFSHTIKKAKSMCERYAEESLHSGRQVAGVIFSLKNNYNWIDNKDITSKGEKLSISISSEIADKYDLNQSTSNNSEG